MVDLDNMTNASGRLKQTGKPLATLKMSLGEDDENGGRSSLFVGSVEKAFLVLHAFHASKRPLSLSEISSATGMGKSSAQRFCYTLVALGLLERDEGSRRMRPSARLLEMSYTYLASDPINSIAAPYLVQAREACGQAVNLGIPIDQDVIYIARLPSHKSHLSNPIIGGRAPMFCTSSGRAYLSTLEPQEIENIIKESDLSPLTRHTITDPSEIMKRIEQVQIKGYAMAYQECIPSELSIAAPIFGAGHKGIGSMNICVTMPTWSMERIEEELAPLVTQTAHEISLALAN